MYLSRIRINPHRRASRKLLSSPQAMHAAVLNCYMDAPEPTPDARVLWRVDQHDRAITLYVSGPARPDLTQLREEASWPNIDDSASTVEYTPFLAKLEKGQRWAFRLTANPVRHARTQRHEDTVPLGHVTPERQRQWLFDRADKHGIELGPDDVVVQASRTWQFRRGGATVSLRTATFDGVLEIVDVHAFRRLLCAGIGRARGYGCGLMTVARPLWVLPRSRHLVGRNLTRMENRISFLYVEECVVERDQNALTLRDQRGVRHVPGAALGVLLLGPGTSISHRARELLAVNGAVTIDVGQSGVRCYGYARPLSSSTAWLQAQARAWGNDRTRLRVAREMYRIRFNEDPGDMSMRQLRSAEGARVKACYRAHATRTGVAWTRREYDRQDFEAGTPINQALSAGAACLYGVTHAVIVAMGMSPGLGFIHTGYYPSFVHDIADLYKATTSIPIAFDAVASGGDDVAADVRRAMRDRFRSTTLIADCVRDLRRLVAPELDTETPCAEAHVITLWDEILGEVPGGVDYSGDAE